MSMQILVRGQNSPLRAAENRSFLPASVKLIFNQLSLEIITLGVLVCIQIL